MTTANEVRPDKTFVPTLLPWVIAAAALSLYLITRDGWQSVASAQTVAVVSGWSFQIDVTRPLYWLATLPLRLLPDAWVPLGLTAFSAVCGALTLALLARSVALLPHDRTEAQRLRERSPFSLLSIRAAWLPPILAAVACGLQLTFWEHASGISTEIFDLLLFAYVVRCLLEFRFNGADSWLLRACFVYAAAMTNNWAIVAMAPLFLAALVWMKGWSFFSASFLSRAFFTGSAGLCFFLVMPAVCALSGTSTLTFWQALKANLGQEKNFIGFFITNKEILYLGEHPLWVLALPSLLPVLALSIRWPATFGDHSKLGQGLATMCMNVLHGAFLAVSAWIVLDPTFSPRNYIPMLSGLPFLPLYFLAALSIGYFSGYFLLLFGGAEPTRKHRRPQAGYEPLLNMAVTAAIWALTLFLPLMLVYVNVGQLGRARPILREYAGLKAQALPKNAVALSDNPIDTLLVDYFLTEAGLRKDVLLLDTQALAKPAYHRFLAKRHPGVWNVQADPARDEVQGAELASLLTKLAETRPIFYLHPSFGYYFEAFYPEPFGPILKLISCGTNFVLQPPLSPELAATNAAFWARVEDTQLKPIMAARSAPEITQWRDGIKALDFLGPIAEQLGLTRTVSREPGMLAASYSRALNFWGVQLQRNNNLPEAERCFVRALELSPENVMADFSLQCNRNLKAGQEPRVKLTDELMQKLRKRGTMAIALNVDGPVDEPAVCEEAALLFTQGANYRQAAEEYTRLAQFYPNDLAIQIRLAETMFAKGAARRGFDILQKIQERPETFGLTRTNYPALFQAELAAYLINKDLPAADRLVQTALDKYGGDEGLLDVASYVYMNAGYSSNALQMLDRQLKSKPDDTRALVNVGVAWLRLTNYSNALPPLTRVVDMGTNSGTDLYYRALYNRALAHEGNQQLDLARRDWEELQGVFTNMPVVALKLAQIGDQRKDTALAIRNYELLVQNTPTNSPESSNALARLKDLKSGKR